MKKKGKIFLGHRVKKSLLQPYICFPTFMTWNYIPVIKLILQVTNYIYILNLAEYVKFWNKKTC